MANDNIYNQEQIDHINTVADALAVLICKTLADEKMAMAHGLTALAVATTKVCNTLSEVSGARPSAVLEAYTGAMQDCIIDTKKQNNG